MPKVPQLDWSKLKPKIPVKQNSHGTLNFPTHEIIEAKSNSKNGQIKVTRPPKRFKRKRTKIKDKRLFNDVYDQGQHLRNIVNED